MYITPMFNSSAPIYTCPTSSTCSWWNDTLILIGSYYHTFITCVLRPPLDCIDTCSGPTMGCIKSYGDNPTWFKMHSVWLLMPSACFFHSGVRAWPHSVGTYTDAPPAVVLTAYNQPSNRALPSLVQGTMIHLCGLLLKWVPVTRVF